MTNPSARPTGDNTPNGSNSPLPGITRERVTFENSIVGAVETVDKGKSHGLLVGLSLCFLRFSRHPGSNLRL